MKINKQLKALGLSLVLSTSVAMVVKAADQDYPFELPDSVATQININTSKKEPFNNKLLGTNIFGFTSDKDQELINIFDPLTVRFPHGLWANWYDWELDKSRVFGTEKFEYLHVDGTIKNKEIDHLASLKIFENSSSQIGIDGLTDLNTIRKSNLGKGYDMLWTFNMSADGTDFDNGSPVSVARYNDLVSRGFEVKAIEMGNENFYPGQRSSIIPNTEDYLKRAKSMSAALKAIDPNIKVSVPLLRRESWPNPNWNRDLTADLSYFDAVTVHTYVGSDPDDADSPQGAYSDALTARHHIAASVDNYAGKVAPSKPIWLSEWGVKSGGPKAASVIGMTDVYLFMSENQNRYERANWFSVNGQLNSFLKWETYTSPSGVIRPRIQYPLIKTAFGSAHQIMRSVLQDSILLESSTDSVTLEHGVQAISARAVRKGDHIELLVLNKTDKVAPFSVKIDGVSYNGSISHQTMKFDSVGEEREMPITQDPLSHETLVDGGVVLPPLSINKITLSDANVPADVFSINMTTDENTMVYQIGETINLNAKVLNTASQIESVIFSQGEQIISTISAAPFKSAWSPSLPGEYELVATAKAVDGTEKQALITITVEGAALQITTSISSNDVTEITLGESVSLTATSETNYGNITNLDILINDEVVQQSTNSEAKFDWKPTALGTYQIKSLAKQSDGYSENSSVMSITVVAAPEPAPQPTPKTDSSGGGSSSILMLLVMSGFLWFRAYAVRR
ncbi:hypothetical protein L0668_12165 [Paraglaciecola aquimarina]|uniref:Asl1-like glycosyl hydrolase catalytic domain-containing protein n=1 Tax=Paraglaciecola algarum TaxID=3050085 RepID=A0ABS9DB55_9ALTE|nr:hypothetical protein [Paraglaciecola sp. G1-23]MCF2948866.1 hypothetical protein [Paraglaciecola sp. G1-23]